MPQAAPERCLPLRAAALGRAVWTPLADAAGRIVGEAVGLYPPGVALCAPGERLLAAQVEALLAAERAGATLFGVRDGRVCTVPEGAKRD